MSFATDFASSYATSVATTLGLDNTTVKVSCLYREADVLKIDLLTLSGSCGGAGADRRLARRLQDSGFGVEVKLVGEAVQQIGDGGGASAAMDALDEAEVVVVSSLIPGGSIAAAVSGVLVRILAWTASKLLCNGCGTFGPYSPISNCHLHDA